jgi:molecular chaperone Hsp33
MSQDASTAVESLFVRNRNCLLTRADLAPLFETWRAHVDCLKQLEFKPETQARFLQALGAFTLHAASRPRNEHLSWTINFQQPRLNLFLVADTSDSTVAGRPFEAHVKPAHQQSFFQDFVPRGREPIRSHITFTGDDPLLAAEQFYERSEQRPARFFQVSETEFAILSAHPDWDETWLREVTLSGIKNLDQTHTLSLLEQRRYRWQCGCSKQKLMELLLPMLRADFEGFFGDDQVVEANCPRCAASYSIERAEAQAALG